MKTSKIKIIGSGSSGNCIAIYNNIGEYILLDVGLPYEDIMKALDHELDKCVCVLVSHNHKDHSKSLDKFIKYGVHCFANDDVCNNHAGCSSLRNVREIGGFKIQTFGLKHNVENNAFVVDSDGLRYLYVTDTIFVPKIVRNVNYAIIEANYDDDYIVDNAVNNNFSQSMHYNHQSLDRCCEYLKKIYSKSLNGIILHHLSDSNICEQKAVNFISSELGFNNVFAAHKDMEIKTFRDEF